MVTLCEGISNSFRTHSPVYRPPEILGVQNVAGELTEQLFFFPIRHRRFRVRVLR